MCDDMSCSFFLFSFFWVGGCRSGVEGVMHLSKRFLLYGILVHLIYMFMEGGWTKTDLFVLLSPLSFASEVYSVAID